MRTGCIAQDLGPATTFFLCPPSPAPSLSVVTIASRELGQAPSRLCFVSTDKKDAHGAPRPAAMPPSPPPGTAVWLSEAAAGCRDPAQGLLLAQQLPCPGACCVPGAAAPAPSPHPRCCPKAPALPDPSPAQGRRRRKAAPGCCCSPQPHTGWQHPRGDGAQLLRAGSKPLSLNPFLLQLTPRDEEQCVSVKSFNRPPLLPWRQEQTLQMGTEIQVFLRGKGSVAQ